MMTEEKMTDDEQEELFLASGVADEYRLGKLDFEPDVIYDIGADVGSVAMFASKMFPDAKIVAVEPNPWSYPRLKKNALTTGNVVPVNKAIGYGQMYEPSQCEGPLHWLICGRDAPAWSEGMVPCDVPAVTLDELHGTYGGERYVVKMDCESAELTCLQHEPSRQMIIGSSYFAAELHVWASTRHKMDDVVDLIYRFLFLLAQTHTIYSKAYGACIYVWADRRVNGSVTGGDGIHE